MASGIANLVYMPNGLLNSMFFDDIFEFAFFVMSMNDLNISLFGDVWYVKNIMKSGMQPARAMRKNFFQAYMSSFIF
ncbi:hypothetical protein AN695_0226905 [Serratia marcescens]|uniref:Uncharacterized protein n=1 Tax=Serratia marcescens TaxID=615 RepID=A0A6H2ZVU9_SERMA|nr:hypothetical protein AN695_0226905 [Serratia marcescens]